MNAARGVSGGLVWAFVCAGALSIGASVVCAEEAPSDSLMKSFVRGLADSTDAWYGATVAPLDTAGLDSALAVGLARGPGAGRGRPRRTAGRLSLSPALGFNRVDGGQLGANAGLTLPRGARLSGRLQYTTGTHDYLGESRLQRSWRVPGLRARAEVEAAAGRWTEPFDRDHYDPTMATLAALTAGSDRHLYLRRDGFRTGANVVGKRAEGSIEWRLEHESALPTTTDWTLFGGDPEVRGNGVAARGRTSELGFSAIGTIPGTRFRAGGHYWTSDPRIGSDFTYRRLRLESGGDVSVGRHFALVSQATYGRLRGQALPQDAVFLGGVHSVRTLERNELTGTGNLFARADLVLVDDLRELLHLPLPAWLPLQSNAFVASGALWGTSSDGTRAAITRRDLPRAEEWRSEAGVGLSWRPGIPDPLMMLRFEYAWPIGADGREPRFTLAFQRYLDLLPSER